MSRQTIMRIFAEHFGIEPEENGEYNIDDYDWQSGCYMNGRWFCLAEIVEIIEQNF